MYRVRSLRRPVALAPSTPLALTVQPQTVNAAGQVRAGVTLTDDARPGLARGRLRLIVPAGWHLADAAVRRFGRVRPGKRPLVLHAHRSGSGRAAEHRLPARDRQLSDRDRTCQDEHADADHAGHPGVRVVRDRRHERRAGQVRADRVGLLDPRRGNRHLRAEQHQPRHAPGF